MPEVQALVARFSRTAVVRALRQDLDAVRVALRQDGGTAAFSLHHFLQDVRTSLERRQRPGLRRTVNATGIIVHTNLGRAPLPAAALEALAGSAGGYTNLELDLETGRRGARAAAVPELLRAVTGAEAALAVNNNAAAVLLALGSIAAGGEVIVSRGELVEIGGSFRIPDIIRQSGAQLVEVGTTNKTRLGDYERAITPATRAILKVHQSNYRIVGFTAAVGTAELVPLARRHGLPLVEDLGSGTLVDLRRIGLAYEPTVQDSLKAGADLVTFSGDKLLGGPQAGLIVGSEVLIARLRSNPLLRAVRLDRLRLAALEATLRLYQDADGLPPDVPVIAMLAATPDQLQAKAERLCARLGQLAGVEASVGASVGYAGGGALPAVEIPSRAVTVSAEGVAADALAARLRQGEPAVVGRLEQDRLVLDVRTLAEPELDEVAQAVAEALACGT